MNKFLVGPTGTVSGTDEDNKQIIIGQVLNGVYQHLCDAKDSFHRIHNGWPIEEELLHALAARDVHTIHFKDKFFGDDYYTDLQSFDDFGIEEESKKCGRRLILPKEYWGIEPDYISDSSGFVQLHVHSEFSTLDGLGHIEELVLRARRMKMNAIALTDHGTTFGIFKFHKFCKQAGVKPIIGCECYYENDISTQDRPKNHVVVLVKNETGYKNFLKLITYANTDGFHYKPRIGREALLKYKEGLIILSACIAGRPAYILNKGGEIEEAKAELQWWKDNFGEDYYVEIHPDSLPEYIKVNPVLVKLCEDLGIKTVASNDVHYVYAKDVPVHEALMGIQTQKQLGDPKTSFTSTQYWFKSKEEMKRSFEEFHPQISYEQYERAIANTQEVADKVQSFEIASSIKLPSVKGGQSLEALVKQGFDRIDLSEGKNADVYASRITYELQTIQTLGFENYFLLIRDIINYAKQSGVHVGSGRGSVAGSLVAFCLGITEVDPIEHDLLFERFLNPSRKTMPDIDIDFDATKIDQVLEYIKSNWVMAKISTLVGFQGKGALKDCCRYFSIPYGKAEEITKQFPSNPSLKMTIDAAVLDVVGFKDEMDRRPDLFRVARRLEGRIKTKGVHPAGVIVSDSPITDTVPLRLSDGSKGDVVVQCDMEDVDFLGLLKIDCLASKTQTTLSLARSEVLKAFKNGDIECSAELIEQVEDFSKISLKDPAVYKAFQKGDTLDIFQFQSELGRDTAMKVRPEDFETLVAITALIRPAAIDFIDQFASDDYEPIMGELRPILKDTRNITLYQEQAMRIAVDIAGFSLSKADDLRKAIGKKKADVMSRLRVEFVSGGVAKGHPEGIMSELFSIIEKSSNYAFNKSHAVAYTLSSYYSMWFKVHFLTDWAIAELTVQIEDADKLQRYLKNAKKAGIEFLPPHVNGSEWGFKREGDKVRFGLGMVKQISPRSYGEIEAKRPYTSFVHFINTVSGQKCNRGAVRSLIAVGALDNMGPNRNQMTLSISDVALKTKRADLKVDPATPEWDDKALSEHEKEAFGFNFFHNPLNVIKEDLAKHGIDLDTGLAHNGRNIKAAGYITNVKEWESKNGLMGFVDVVGSIELSIILWHDSFITYQSNLRVGRPVIVYGRKLEQYGKIAVDTGKGDKILFLDESKRVSAAII